MIACILSFIFNLITGLYKLVTILISLAQLQLSNLFFSSTTDSNEKVKETRKIFARAESGANKKEDDDNDNNNKREPFRVCVVGGGIAGMSTAYGLASLQKDDPRRNVEVTLLEPRNVLGGNAKTHEWQKDTFGGVRTGLSVLAWPASLFHNYGILLNDLRQEVEVVTPTFMVSEDGKKMHWVHAKPENSELGKKVNAWAQEDMEKWDSGCRWARRFNVGSAFVGLLISSLLFELPCSIFNFFFVSLIFGNSSSKNTAKAQFEEKKTLFEKLEDNKKSLYAFSLLNPLNVISLEFWMKRLFFVSDRFWNTVVIPVYSSSFLTTSFHELPASICPPLDHIISVGAAEPCKPLHTWRKSSKDVFDAMKSFVESVPVEDGRCLNRILTGCVVEHVIPSEFSDSKSEQYKKKQQTVRYSSSCSSSPSTSSSSATSASSSSSSSQQLQQLEETFDVVVFACPGPEARKMIHSSQTATSGNVHRPGALGHLLDNIVGGIDYEDTRDDNYVTGVIHHDKNVIPATTSSPEEDDDMQKTFFDKKFSNYVRCLGKPTQMCNVFSLGTWVPAALREAEKQKLPGGYLPLFVSYDGLRNAIDRKRPEASEEISSMPNPDSVDLCHPAPEPSKRRPELVDNTNAHPRLNLANLARMYGTRFLQGQSGLYYCSNYTTPGNGHDLSLNSGFSVAGKIVAQLEGGANRPRHPVLKAVGTRTGADTEGRRSACNHSYATAVNAQADVGLLRGMMGLA